jgi:RHS repeat-associated protein
MKEENERMKRYIALIMAVVMLIQVSIIPTRAQDSSETEPTNSMVYEDDEIRVEIDVESQWGNQYKANYIITNKRGATVKNWRMEFYSDDIIGQIWNAEIEEHDSNGRYVIKNAGYNRNIKSGEKITFGFIAAFNGEITIPDYFSWVGAKKSVDSKRYSIVPRIQSKWNNGCILELDIKNTSDSVIEEWQLEFDYTGKIDTMWNGQLVDNANGHITVLCENYNSTILPNDKITIGMKLSWEGKYVEPESYYLQDHSARLMFFERGETIKELKHNNFLYSFSYDDNENMTSAAVGDRALFHADYTSDNNLNKMTYGNGDTISYSYDDDGNMISVSVNNKLAYKWEYDEDGEVCKIVDVLNNHEYEYKRNEAEKADIEKCTMDGRFSVVKSEEEEQTSTEYIVGNSKKKKIEYYNDGMDDTEMQLLDGTNNRLIEENGQFKYIIAKGKREILNCVLEKKKGLIASVKYGANRKYNYEYENGNIVAVRRNGECVCSYEYDSKNRLVRENNVSANKTYLYTYDDADNINEVCEYKFSAEKATGNLELIKSNKYEYKDNWGDLLTKYNNQKLEYDEIGNPKKYRDSMSMKWSNGKRLSEISCGSDLIRYKYDYNGNRISKQVNGKTTMFYYDEDSLVYQNDGNNKIWFMYGVDGELAGFLLNGESYYYQKNIVNDVIGIYDNNQKLIVEYEYDAWGNLTGIKGDNNLAQINPIRYKSYYFDSESGFYYLMNRYYDPEVKRMLNTDQYISVAYPNLFSYATNNPVMNADPSGNVIETVIDIASVAWSFADLVDDPSWINLGFLAWDVASVFIPFVPGSYAAKGTKKLLKIASKADDFKDATYLTVGAYSKVKKLLKGAKGVEVHHLIEKRFIKTGKLKNGAKKLVQSKMMAVPISKKLHKTITKRWRKEFKYGYDYSKITKKQMKKAIKNVYKDMPALKKYALKYLEEVWK